LLDTLFLFCYVYFSTNYNSVEDEENHKLYIKIMCTMCLGGERAGIFGNCPYCNRERTTFVEASVKIIKENLNVILEEDEKKDLIEFLSNGTGSSSNYF